MEPRVQFQACTIIARNYLAHARVLYRSFRRFHPDARFSVLVLDSPAATLDEPFHVFALDEIGLPNGEETRMPMLYNVTELATAVKPWFFRHLFRKERLPLLYFDPDIEIFSPVDRLAEFAHKHCLVLTPHTTQPMSRTDVRPNETDILSAGAYNLGFLGLNADCARFLAWWSERLLREAMIDVANMRFTDQRWMDFAPGYFDTFILKDETCNVAYWNADARRLNWSGDRYEVGGKPLCFFHFSGYRPENPHLLSVYQGNNPRTRLSEHPVLARLCHEYAEKLSAADYARLQRIPYGLDRAPGGLALTWPMRLAYRDALRSHEATGTAAPPSAFSDAAAFVAWLNEPLHPQICPEITRYFWAIHRTRPDLRAAFPNLLGVDNRAYYDWLRECGRYQIPIPLELVPSPPGTPVQEASGESEATTAGIAITGYFRAEMGTDEAARLIAAAVEAAGERYCTRTWSGTSSRQNYPWNRDSADESQNYDTNLICINADQLPGFAQSVGREFFRNRYNVGLWYWESELFPPAMRTAFNLVQEIWVTSEFTREAIAKVSPIPVFRIPQPLNVDTPVIPSRSRRALNLPDGFLFLLIFDFSSVVEGKNPVGLIKAFQTAFAPGEGPTLLIKSTNGHRHVAELERLHYARAGRSDIIIRDGDVSAEERHALVAACDCYVSLHRSEGFGLTIAEAMLMEKPTIATRYSGNVEFMNDANSFLCGYNLRLVGDGCAPYLADAHWADPNISEAAELMRLVYENPEEAQRRGKRGRLDLHARHAPQVAADFIKKRLSELRRNPPRPAVSLITSNPERPLVTKIRAAIVQGANIRRIVPPLLTWIFQGPRRAMKQCLRFYEQHYRRISLSAIDAFKEIDAEWLNERDSLRRRIYLQQDELNRLNSEVEHTHQRLWELEKILDSHRAELGNSLRNGGEANTPGAHSTIAAKESARRREADKSSKIA